MQTEKELQEYLEKNLQGKLLEAFKKYVALQQQKKSNNIEGMKSKSQQGSVMSRAPFGYKIIDKQLVPDYESKHKIYEIFRDFLNNISLNQIAKSHGLTVNGIKKILKNHAYIGKVRFAGVISQGTHEPLIDFKLFNDVQKKFDEKKINRQ
jgi:hypothetical protein